MYKGTLLFLAFFLTVSVAISQSIDADNSKVTFEVSNMGFNSVEGTITGMSGTVNFKPNNLDASKFDVCVDASTINTGNDSRDKHLKNEDFFEVDTYPTICFQSTKITKTDDGFLTTGKLTMHGISKNVEIPFTFTDNTLTRKLVIQRLDYEIGSGNGFRWEKR